MPVSAAEREHHRYCLSVARAQLAPALRNYLDQITYQVPNKALHILCPGAGLAPGVPVVLDELFRSFGGQIKLHVTLVDMHKYPGVCSLVQEGLSDRGIACEYISVTSLTEFYSQAAQKNTYDVVFFEHPEIMEIGSMVPSISDYRLSFAALPGVLKEDAIVIGACHYPHEMFDFKSLVGFSLGLDECKTAYGLHPFVGHYSNLLFSRVGSGYVVQKRKGGELTFYDKILPLFQLFGVYFSMCSEPVFAPLLALNMQLEHYLSMAVMLLVFPTWCNVGVGLGARGVKRRCLLLALQAMLCLAQHHVAVPEAQEDKTSGSDLLMHPDL